MAPLKPSFSGSLPIRAPLTLDDSEFDVSSNCTGLDSGSESEGLVGGEEFEMALVRPSVVDPEEDPIGSACEEEEGSVEVDDFAPLVELPAVHQTTLRVMPFAQLSSYDDDEEEEEVVSDVEGNEMFSIVRVPSIDMPQNFTGFPRIKALDVEEEELETLLSRDSSTINQSVIANELTFINDTSSDNFMESENGVVSIKIDERLVVVEHNQTLDGVLEDRVAQSEYSIASDNDIISQYSRTSFNNEQFSKVEVPSNELKNEEGLKLDEMDRLEGGTIKLIETGAVSMNSIKQRKLDVDIKETTEMVEATSITMGDSSLLKSNIEDYNKSRILNRNNIGNHLQIQNPQTQIDFSQTDDLASDAFAENTECAGREPIFCLPTQEAAASGSQGFNLDHESEYGKLVNISKYVINSEDKLHDATARFESGDDDPCEGNNIHSVESANFSEPSLLQLTVYLENDLEDEEFSDCHSHEHVQTGFNLGDTVKEATVDLNAISQESERAGSAPDRDVEGLISVGLVQFVEQISALSTLLGSKGFGKNSQQEQTDRNSHEKMTLLRDDANEELLYTANRFELDCSRTTVTASDKSGIISVKDPAGFSSLPAFERQAGFKHNLSDKEREKVEKIQALSVKFLRLVQRINLSIDDSFVLKVLCRLVADIERRSNQKFVIDSAKFLAKKLEENGEDDLDFSLNILVLGKSGVGKSAIINSIFGEMKVMTNAFEPATTSVKEIAGTIQGVKIRILDTPGLRSPVKDQAFNRKILSSIKRYMKNFPLDVILYVDRVDAQTWDLNDLPLLRSITSSFSPSVWQRAILTLTHAASTPWDGPSGCPLSYEAFVAQKSLLVQQLISQAVGNLCQVNPGFMCPVSLVENHPLCGNNRNGECVLLNGLRWRSQLFVLCFSLKILHKVSSMAGPQTLFDHWKLCFFQNRSAPLNHPLSSLLQSHAHLRLSANWS